jgi:phenylalanyl-tRNA synthetase alpha chain
VNTIRYLSKHNKTPIKVFSIEPVFRKESIDRTHLPEFYQVEGIVVEEGSSFRMLLGILKEFYRRMGFSEIRMRPAYFPYTEPSMEVEVKFKGEWLELGGSGIFRPEVVAPFDVDEPVLAWGLGLERLAMLKFGLDDIRQLYISDLDWLKKSPIVTR